MTLPTTPTNAITTTPRFARIADDRWRFWRGAVAVWLAEPSRVPRPITVTATAIQRDHRAWLLDLLGRGIPLRVIRRLALDDPRELRLVLMARAELYLDLKSKRRSDNVTDDEGTR
jgi:hypothetical protein